MSRRSYRRHSYRARQAHTRTVMIVIAAILLTAAACAGILLIKKQFSKPTENMLASSDQSRELLGTGSSEDTAAGDSGESISSAAADDTAGQLDAILLQAEKLAQGYDYDGAIALLNTDERFASDAKVTEAVASYEADKASLVPITSTEVTHVFFHTLIMDNKKAFDGDQKEGGYNQMMTTKDEFLKIMQSMYDKGYVLIRLHDLAYETTDENGNPVFKYGDVKLPEGKKAFILSQDDVCYYEYMEGDGFATKMIIGEDGMPTCEMKMDDGTVSVGAYDLVPILEQFIAEHPGFSYKGARGVLAFTGYNGILGYRTAASYKSNPTYESDRAEAAKVAQALRDAGWELASHSWGHRNMGKIPMTDFKTDTDKWETEVESLIGPTDIILFPFGSDVGSWMPYTDDNERFVYLKSKGFRYFCNVDSAQYWVQMGSDHLRQGRRNLDGYRMYYDMIDPESHKLDDLFDPAAVFDKDRPTPVPPMS